MTGPKVHRDEKQWSSFVEAVRSALDADSEVKRLIGESKGFRTPAFEFVKRIKPHPMVRELPAITAGEMVTAAFKEIFPGADEGLLWEQALGTENTKGEHSDPYLDFLNVWEECQKPGAGDLEEAVQRAMEDPRPKGHFGPQYAGERLDNFRFFLTICEELQMTRGEQNIYLPVQSLAFQMDVSHQTVSGLRKLARTERFLELKEDHVPFAKATEFRFHHPGNEPVSLAPDKQDQQEIQDRQETRETEIQDSQENLGPDPRPTQKHIIRDSSI